MITPQEATQRINEHLFSFPAEPVALENANGRILRESIRADRDFPPFDRVTMDGIAYDIHGLKPDQPTLIIEGTQLAGEPPKTLSAPTHCLEAMTGAVLPKGANAVTPYEDIDIQEQHGQKIAVLRIMPTREGQNVHPQGHDQPQGEELIPTGTRMNATQIAVAASVGKAQLSVTRPPNVAIVSTGDELVAVHEQPEPYQIRQSNNHALRAALEDMNIPSTFYHLPDSLEKTKQGLAQILEQHPVIVLSGGVSRGKKDYVPEALESLGVQKLFHKVKQRPGKPFWFGTKEDQNVVFALPGNPVSTFMCFHRYLKPWLEKSIGLTPNPPLLAALNDHVKFEPELTYFMQVKAYPNEEGHFVATPLEGHGSGDFANLLQCNGFLELPADRSHFIQGEVFPFIPFA